MDGQLLQLLKLAASAQASGDLNQASRCLEQAQRLQPDDLRILCNAANLFWLRNQPEHAIALFEQAIALDPLAALPHRGLGNALRDINAFEQAHDAYAQSLALDDNPLTAWNHSQLLLGLERYPEAYRSAERRLELKALLPYRKGPYADGRSHALLRSESCDYPLNLWSEQGLGDTLQYLRWLVPLSQQPNAITLEVEHQLVDLIQQGLSWLPHPPAVTAKAKNSSEAPGLDTPHTSLLSLPYHLGRAPLPDVVPYLNSDAWPRSHQRQTYPCIGLVWAAGRKLDDLFTAREYRKRSLCPHDLGQLVENLHQFGAHLVNLQVGPDRDMAVPLASRFADALPESADFAATAAVVQQLDLVISVDTAMAHLAGALGHPAWILLPHAADPRWLRDRSDSPWYPSLRLWRQPSPGQWSELLATLLAELKRLWRLDAPLTPPN